MLAGLAMAAGAAAAGSSYAAIPSDDDLLEPAPVAGPAHPGELEASEPVSPGPQQLSGAPQAIPPLISLEPGEVHSLSVENLSRVAIGNPKVVDLNVVSANELLLQALQPGATNIILWDDKGQHVSNIEVVDRSSVDLEDKLRQMVQEIGLSGVEVKRQEEKIFLTGQVANDDEFGRLDQMLGAYGKQVNNLVGVAPKPVEPPEPLPMSVKLTVQLIEMSRDATDRIGVDWADRLTFTESTFGALGPQNVSQVARLGEAFRLGALSRTGFNPVLNMLVTNGKARVLAEPKLVAASGKSATTFIGVEVPVITVTSISSGTVSQNIEFKKTGVDLQFQPTVLNKGEAIQLAVDAKVSSIDTVNSITVSGITVPGFRIRQTQTEVITKPGETIFIAGLLQDEERKNLSAVPGAGSIPVLGTLFKSTEFVRGKTELIVVITPELTNEPEMTTDRTLAVDQALSGAEVASSVDNPVLRYALLIQERIAKSIRYPQSEEENGIGGEVKLRLHLFRDGTLGRAMVAQSSGSDMLDTEALKAAETQAPYPAFPSDLSQLDLWIDVPVVFRP